MSGYVMLVPVRSGKFKLCQVRSG